MSVALSLLYGGERRLMQLVLPLFPVDQFLHEIAML